MVKGVAFLRALPCTVLVLAAACATAPADDRGARATGDTLTVREDGSMWFRNRPLPPRDVIIYADGAGGEKAAVRIRMEPLHPDFFRDTIIVVRE